MDNLTHTLFAATLARTALRRGGRGTTTALILASNAPDIDIVATAGGALKYLEWHRGPSHGPLGIVGLGLLTAGLVWSGWRVFDRQRAAGLPSFRQLAIVSVVGVLLHVLMDLPTAYGTRLFSPFDWHWYAIDLMPAWGSAQQSMSETQRGRCSSDVGGDTHRNLFVQDQFSYVTFKHVLLPIWIAAYRYGDKPYQFLVNGQTGEVVGRAPWSFWKIFLTILAVIGVAVGGYLIWDATQKKPPTPAPTPAVVTAAPAIPAKPAATAPTKTKLR